MILQVVSIRESRVIITYIKKLEWVQQKMVDLIQHKIIILHKHQICLKIVDQKARLEVDLIFKLIQIISLISIMNLVLLSKIFKDYDKRIIGSCQKLIQVFIVEVPEKLYKHKLLLVKSLQTLT